MIRLFICFYAIRRYDPVRRAGILEIALSYDDILTEIEFAVFRSNAEVVRYLELMRARLGLACGGRGEYIVWLRVRRANPPGGD
jgi:hypothetical protein